MESAILTVHEVKRILAQYLNMNPEEVEIKFIDTNGFAVNAIQDVIVRTK